MNNPIFSQAAIFRLQQLASSIHTHTGVRHKLSEAQSLMTLLRCAAEAPTAGIAMQYQAFIRILTRTERDELQRRGVPLSPAHPGHGERVGRKAV